MSDEKQTVDKPLSVTQKVTPTGPDTGPAVRVDEEKITPVTRKEIKKINATEWDRLSVTKLYEQLSVLRSRLAYAHQIGHAEMAKQLQNGIARLEETIRSKKPTEETII